MKVTINGMTIEGTEADVMRMYTLINASHNVEVSRTGVTQQQPNNIDTYYDNNIVTVSGGDNQPIQSEYEIIRTRSIEGHTYYAIKSRVYSRSWGRRIANDYISNCENIITFHEPAEYSRWGFINAWGYTANYNSRRTASTSRTIREEDKK